MSTTADTEPITTPSPSDDDLYRRAVAPYVTKRAVLLRSASIARCNETVTATGQFGITESCYIDDTGHFNAAEFIISYNQLLYLALAHSVRDSLIPALAHWTPEDYWSRQLPNVLITRCSSRFRRPITPTGYQGRLTIGPVTYRNRSQPVLTFVSSVEFHDDSHGWADGEIGIALTDPVSGGDRPC